MSEKKTVIVTGGGGFIGSHLCDRFLARGMKVFAIDNFLVGNERNLELSRYAVHQNIDSTHATLTVTISPAPVWQSADVS